MVLKTISKMQGNLLPKVILEISMQRDKVQVLPKQQREQIKQTKKTHQSQTWKPQFLDVLEIILLGVFWM